DDIRQRGDGRSGPAGCLGERQRCVDGHEAQRSEYAGRDPRGSDQREGTSLAVEVVQRHPVGAGGQERSQQGGSGEIVAGGAARQEAEQADRVAVIAVVAAP
ncbi:MAG: hypothetical protein RLY45_566, partial [Actinomycetota bacterium]